MFTYLFFLLLFEDREDEEHQQWEDHCGEDAEFEACVSFSEKGVADGLDGAFVFGEVGDEAGDPGADGAAEAAGHGEDGKHCCSAHGEFFSGEAQDTRPHEADGEAC